MYYVGSLLSTSFIIQTLVSSWIWWDWCMRSEGSKIISRLGDCLSDPQWLIYVCTWNRLNACYVLRDKWMNDDVCCQHAVLPVQRWPTWGMFQVAMHGSVTVESCHSLTSGGYTHDMALAETGHGGAWFTHSCHHSLVFSCWPNASQHWVYPHEKGIQDHCFPT